MILIVKTVNGRFLECWVTGGLQRTVDPGVFPHFWSLYRRKNSIPFEKRLLSEIEKITTLFRVDVAHVNNVRKLRDEESLEANIPFVQLLVMLFGFKHDAGEPKHAAWDMELIVKGQFPPIGKVPISDLSWFSPTREEVLQGDEESIIEGFVDIAASEDVDIYDTYNGDGFDWRVLKSRAELHNIDLVAGRKKDRPWIRGFERRYGKYRGMEYEVYLAGRLSYDIWARDVRYDTALTGKVNDRGLKTVSRFMFPEEDFIKVDRARIGNLTSKERYDYCLSDARATYMLAEHYLGIQKLLARKLGAPLNLIIMKSPSHTGNYVYGKEFKKLNVVSDGANFKRFEGILW